MKGPGMVLDYNAVVKQWVLWLLAACLVILYCANRAFSSVEDHFAEPSRPSIMLVGTPKVVADGDARLILVTIRNNAEFEQRRLFVTSTGVDSSGKVVEQPWDYAPSIKPGEQWDFRLTVFDRLAVTFGPLRFESGPVVDRWHERTSETLTSPHYYEGLRE